MCERLERNLQIDAARKESLQKEGEEGENKEAETHEEAEESDNTSDVSESNPDPEDTPLPVPSPEQLEQPEQSLKRQQGQEEDSGHDTKQFKRLRRCKDEDVEELQAEIENHETKKSEAESYDEDADSDFEDSLVSSDDDEEDQTDEGENSCEPVGQPDAPHEETPKSEEKKDEQETEENKDVERQKVSSSEDESSAEDAKSEKEESSLFTSSSSCTSETSEDTDISESSDEESQEKREEVKQEVKEEKHTDGETEVGLHINPNIPKSNLSRWCTTRHSSFIDTTGPSSYTKQLELTMNKKQATLPQVLTVQNVPYHLPWTHFGLCSSCSVVYFYIIQKQHPNLYYGVCDVVVRWLQKMQSLHQSVASGQKHLSIVSCHKLKSMWF